MLRIARGATHAVADRLPPRPRKALLHVAWGARILLFGVPPKPPPKPRPPPPPKPPKPPPKPPPRPKPPPPPPEKRPPKPLPRSFRVKPPAPPIPEEWPEPPAFEGNPAEIFGGEDARHSTTRYGIELFEALNAEYASKPVLAAPPGQDAISRADRARQRLLVVHNSIDLADKRVLEIGCGAGYEVWYLAHQFGSDAYGVDIAERRAWRHLEGPRTHFLCADVARGTPYPTDYFDRVVSFTVWEHVEHPFAALQETFRVMKPGGLAWIKANLYRSAVASHAYRHINFPFPHLLFTDEVISEFFRRRGIDKAGASWVNKLTWAQYQRYFELVGFELKSLRFTERPLDEDFYRRFEDVLGRYPRWDLTKDFFTVVARKPGMPGTPS